MFEKQIQAGLVYLDIRYPGWINRINLETLQLKDGCHCIIGQLEGNFVENRDMISYQHPFLTTCSQLALDLGFVYTNSEDYDEKYNLLTQEWKEAILARRQQSIAAEIVDEQICI